MTQSARTTLFLTAVNMAVYSVMLLCWVLRGIYPALPAEAASLLTLPSSPADIASHPWSATTYMFTHVNFIHLTVNMLWLLGFGAIIKGDGRYTATAYIAGGIAGAAAFIAYSCFTGMAPVALAGASASVISVVLTAAILSPGRKIRLLLLGDISIKWIAPVALLTLFAGFPAFSAATAAHLAGASAGIFSGIMLRRREKAYSRKAMEKARAVTRRRKLLDKAGISGFAALSEAERRELFDLSS